MNEYCRDILIFIEAQNEFIYSVSLYLNQDNIYIFPSSRKKYQSKMRLDKLIIYKTLFSNI